MSVETHPANRIFVETKQTRTAVRQNFDGIKRERSARWFNVGCQSPYTCVRIDGDHEADRARTLDAHQTKCRMFRLSSPISSSYGHIAKDFKRAPEVWFKRLDVTEAGRS